MKVTPLVVGGFALALLGAALTGAKAAPVARVSPAQAKAAAAKKMSGKALSAVYELEDGHWQYAVMVQKGKTLYEVAVNSTTGRVMDSEKTTPAEEKTEAAADKKAAMGQKAGQKAGQKPTGAAARPAAEKPEAKEGGAEKD